MCTLIALHHCFPGVPLVVAANRDEALGRPAEAPALRMTQGGPIVAPRDVKAGGTWLGLNAAGVFAAVTNRPCAKPDPGRRSRGLLVLDALAASSAAEAARWLEETLVTGVYNPFNLFVADRERAFVTTCDEAPRQVELSAGAHVIGNCDPEGAPTCKVALQREHALRVAAGPADAAQDELTALCRSHHPEGAVASTCVHAGAYGTCSSTQLWLTGSGVGSTLRFAGGAPCETPYEDFSPLLDDLSHVSRYARAEAATRKVS